MGEPRSYTVGSGRAESSACAAEVSVADAAARSAVPLVLLLPSPQWAVWGSDYAKQFTILNYRLFIFSFT